MTYKEALELLNIFTRAAQEAKKRDKIQYHLEMDEETLVELLKKAFPRYKSEEKIIKMAKHILNTQEFKH
jgi:hypothetical protein